jgi:predicted ferric reductase
MTATASVRAKTGIPPRSRGRGWWLDVIGGVAAGSVVIVLALWLHGGNLQQLSAGGASALTAVGRLTGLIAADLLLMQVVLMARLPWLERQFGQDRLARWHRVVGFTSIMLLVVHVVTITVGYAGSDRSSLLHQAVALTLTYPGMLLAVAGTVALLMVAVTSVKIARARLRYESWHLLHLYAYLGVGLSLPHQLWTGADFTSTPLARIYWWGVYALAAACILAFRIGLPLWRMLRHDLRVHEIVPESRGITSVYVRGRHLHRMRVEAGQFFNWRFLGPTPDYGQGSR